MIVPFDASCRVPPSGWVGRSTAGPGDGTWRPMLVTALRPAWRDTGTVQFGVDPARAVVVDGVGEQSVRLLLGLDGGRTEAEVLAAAAEADLDVPFVAALLDDLRDAGVLADAQPPPAPLRPADPGQRRPDRDGPPAPSTSEPPSPLPPPPAGADQPSAGDRVPSAAADPAGSPPPPQSGGDSSAAGQRQPAVKRRRPRRRSGGQALGLPATVSGRLSPDHASLSLLAADRGLVGQAPDDVLDRRRAAAVVVHGAGRVGATLAALLGAAGVGHVHVVDRGPVRPADLTPGGLAAADLHRSRGTAAADAIHRGAPEAQTTPLPAYRLPDLVVISSTRPVDSDLAAALAGAALPHLVAGVRETTAVVGPLVLPGRTSCLRCADLHRSDRDPAWPLLAAQLTGHRARAPAEPCDVSLAALAAALGALQCLGHLDGEAVTCRSGTLELALPGWRLRRRSWPPHPRCDCGASAAAGGRPAEQREWST